MKQGIRTKSLLPFLALLAVASTPASAKDYTRLECPVIGNVSSGIYHTPASDAYRKLLKENQNGEDNRTCFKTEQEARNAGYRKSRK
ncbi:MAG: hypothetical protein K2Y16_11475 [Burkholderiales bacterium]|nr:hypothetical protein [Burkholderiales bacterium]